MFNNEYYQFLVGKNVRYIDGQCIAQGWSEGKNCQDFEPVSTGRFEIWRVVFGVGKWTEEEQKKWKTSWENPGAFSFKYTYKSFKTKSTCADNASLQDVCQGDFK